ncbi:hypothetical protein RJ640_028297 [Escallonia rubra]|uniref:Uncharacterized protein n=1 Tax=Escallonia rubra TaxID=112253 RepID=A0AA88S182_9ASTE|nr:hypothetical protein RJ640_028297 [Escallonia rubra]
MRKLVPAIDINGIVPQPALSPSLPPFSSGSPSPSPFSDGGHYGRPLFFVPPIAVMDSAFDLATLSFISGLFLLSLLSLSFIFHLRLKSHRSHHLRNFNNLWSVRLLLVSFVALWSINEVLRLPFFRRRYLFPFLPALTLIEQASLCKVHLVLSLGLFEPGFLVTLLFLVNISIKKQNPNQMRAFTSVLITCFPVLLLQTVFVFLSPLQARLPLIMHRTSVLSMDAFGNKTVMCTYPLSSWVVFAAFGLAYVLGFILSCWRVVTFVINKKIRDRINLLAFTVMVAVPMQIFFLGVSSFWTPEESPYGVIVLAIFICAALCGVVGECILVIKPIADALAAGGDCCQWSPGIRLRRDAERERLVDRSQ